MQLGRAGGERYAGERCEGGMKITQFVLSSCEKTEEKKKGQRAEGERGLKQVTGEQRITLSGTQERRETD